MGYMNLNIHIDNTCVRDTFGVSFTFFVVIESFSKVNV